MKSIKKVLCLVISLAFVMLSACGYTMHSNDYNGANNDNGGVAPNMQTTLPIGVYTFRNAGENKYLLFNERQLKLDDNATLWKLRPANGGVYVYCCSNELLLDIDNAYVASGTTIKIWENTGYETQIWKLISNQNGSYSFVSAVNESYCLGFLDGKAILQLRQDGDSSQEWYAVSTVDNTVKQYREYISNNGIVELRLPLNVTEVIPSARLQQWANDLEKAYYTFEELTSFKPYEFVIVKAYEPITEYENVLAYVYDFNNTIYVDSDFILIDLAKMNKRNNDWNFCLLHEMGHMFDCNRPWNFESETLTDMKLPYVLEMNGAGAELSEFGDKSVRYGKDIMLSYKEMSGDLSQEYDIFALSYKFMQIKEQIGWEPFKSTFSYLQKNEANYYNLNKREKFELFVNTLSNESGQKIRNYFTNDEWNTIVTYLK